MPTPTYTPLANITLTGSSSTVTFSSISGAYRDLVLIITGTDSGGTRPAIRLNSDSGLNYSYVKMTGNGSTATSATSNAFEVHLATFTSSTPATYIVNVMDYSATDKHKTVLVRSARSDSDTVAIANRWASTSAVTSITVLDTTWASGSTMALYGIAA